jgi:general secretion pathway protein G
MPMWSRAGGIRGYRARAFTLLELMTAVVLTAVLASIAVAAYRSSILKAQTAQAISDIGRIALEVERYRVAHEGSIPDTLAQLGLPVPLDPWKRPYAFLNFSTLPPGGQALMRKDRNLVPINTEYDLYSVGPDGDTRPPLTASPSRDDIVRANDGGFIGKASDY